MTVIIPVAPCARTGSELVFHIFVEWGKEQRKGVGRHLHQRLQAGGKGVVNTQDDWGGWPENTQKTRVLDWSSRAQQYEK